MSLYYDAASLISNKAGLDSLKLSVYSHKNSLKTSPGRVYALLSETLKWNHALKEAIEASGLLFAEHKLTPELALVLGHDLLIRPKGIEAPTTHPLRAAIERHRTRLKAELTRIRVRMQCKTLDELKQRLDQGPNPHDQENDAKVTRPRWVRVNRLVTTLDEQLKTTFDGYEDVGELSAVMNADKKTKKLYVDRHIPDLLAVPWGVDLTGAAYEEGKIILQDKASCFPAYLLDPRPGQVIIDGCAAPGNKTTHLAALLAAKQQDPEDKAPQKTIWAFERDKERSKILEKMLHTAHAESYVTIKSATDFLSINCKTTNFENAPWLSAECILLDPSCSGSGIMGRDEGVPWQLPSSPAAETSRKRKRETEEGRKELKQDERWRESEVHVELHGDEDYPEHNDRIRNLSVFQSQLLSHAMNLPKARRIVYSTCSIHEQENEDIVLDALAHDGEGTAKGWRIVPRDKQPEGLRNWPVRGSPCDKPPYRNYKDKKEILDACIRCSKHDERGTQGFFVVAFEKDGHQQPSPNQPNVPRIKELNGEIEQSRTDRKPRKKSRSKKKKTANDSTEEHEEGEWEGFGESE